MMVDEADIDVVAGSSPSRGSKRSALSEPSPRHNNKRKPGPLPKDTIARRPSVSGVLPLTNSLLQKTCSKNLVKIIAETTTDSSLPDTCPTKPITDLDSKLSSDDDLPSVSSTKSQDSELDDSKIERPVHQSADETINLIIKSEIKLEPADVPIKPPNPTMNGIIIKALQPPNGLIVHSLNSCLLRQNVSPPPDAPIPIETEVYEPKSEISYSHSQEPKTNATFEKDESKEINNMINELLVPKLEPNVVVNNGVLTNPKVKIVKPSNKAVVSKVDIEGEVSVKNVELEIQNIKVEIESTVEDGIVGVEDNQVQSENGSLVDINGNGIPPAPEVEENEKEVYTNNMNIRTLCFIEIRKPGIRHRTLFNHMKSLKGNIDTRLCVVEDIIAEALRFKRQNLATVLKNYVSSNEFFTSSLDDVGRIRKRLIRRKPYDRNQF